MPATTRARALAGVAALLLGACAIPVGRTGQVLDRRRVAAKVEGESVLVAEDGARCQVDRDTFAQVEVGEPRMCLWREREGDARRIGRVP